MQAMKAIFLETTQAMQARKKEREGLVIHFWIERWQVQAYSSPVFTYPDRAVPFVTPPPAIRGMFWRLRWTGSMADSRHEKGVCSRA